MAFSELHITSSRSGIVTVAEDKPWSAFRRFVDPALMRDVFRHVVPVVLEEDCAIARVAVLTSRYKGYRNPASWAKSTLSVCYEITTSSRLRAERVAVVYAKIFLDGRSRDAWRRLAPAHVREAGSDTTVLYLPDLDAILWRFPHDPTIVTLSAAASSAEVLKHCRELGMPFVPDGGAGGCEVATELVKYSPEKCCTLRHTLTRGSAGRRRSTSLYGKTYSDDGGREIQRRTHDLWCLAKSDPHALHVATPLGYSDRLHTAWQLGVEGRTLIDVLRMRPRSRYLSVVGAGLATIHNSDLTSTATIDLDDMVADLVKKIGKLSHACPDIECHLAPIASRVLRDHAATTRRDRNFIHGDFHVEQLLVSGGNVFLFDFDSCAMGESEQDLAEFVVALLDADFDVSDVRTMTKIVLAGYERHAHGRTCCSRVRWYCLIESVTRAHHHYRHQLPGWEERLRRWVSRLWLLDTLLPNDQG